MLIGQEKKAKQLFFDCDSALIFVFYPDLIPGTGEKQKLGTEMVTLKTNFVIKALNLFVASLQNLTLTFSVPTGLSPERRRSER